MTSVYPDIAGQYENPSFELAKHIPHEYDWKWINEDEVIEQKKGKKNKETVTKLLVKDIEIRRAPILIKDGDKIGVRFNLLGNEEETDDFQTEQDLADKEAFAIAKKQADKEKAAFTASQKRHGGDGAAVKIDLDEDIPVVEIN